MPMLDSPITDKVYSTQLTPVPWLIEYGSPITVKVCRVYWTLLLILNTDTDRVVSYTSVCYAIASDALCYCYCFSYCYSYCYYCYPQTLVPIVMSMTLFISTIYSLHIIHCNTLLIC